MKFEKYFMKAVNSIANACVALVIWAAIYSREWFPSDILGVELRLYGITQRLDVLGTLLLIGIMMGWLYFRDVVFMKIWMFMLGLYYKLSDLIRGLFENLGA